MNKIRWYIDNVETFKEVIRGEYETIFRYQYGKPYNQELRYMSESERQQSINAINEGITDLSEDSVKYYINEYGTRGDWSIESKSTNKTRIAFFGCSFCFGVGIDEDETFQAYVKKNWPNEHIEIINLGFPGGSISKSLKFFNYLTSISQIDIAIFLMPTHLRDEYLTRDSEGVLTINNMIPNFQTLNSEKEWEMFYEVNNNDNLLYRVVKDVRLIESIAKERQVSTFYSSWDTETYHNIIMAIRDREKMLPYFKFTENMKNGTTKKGMARDGMHPGPETQETFGKEIIEHLGKYFKSKKTLT